MWERNSQSFLRQPESPLLTSLFLPPLAAPSPIPTTTPAVGKFYLVIIFSVSYWGPESHSQSFSLNPRCIAQMDDPLTCPQIIVLPLGWSDLDF